MENKKPLLRLLVAGGVVSALYYFAWWFEFDRVYHPLWLLLLVMALIYSLAQVFGVWYIFLHAKRVKPLGPPSSLSVDVYIPTYNEPLGLVERTLTAALTMRYPHRTYLIDDGRNAKYRHLAERLGAHYISRATNIDNKAGNVNNALAHTKGEFVAIFDLDHVPQPDFLDRALGYLRDPQVGFVQVMLSHYNQAESFVAGGCAELIDRFFGASMLGMHGCDCATVFGSNCIFRRQALESIGGYQPGLAEDLNTSIHLHAAGWRSVYVPEVLAHGLVPADLASFFKQQLKWSRGVLGVLREAYPRLVKSLNLNMHICYLMRMTYYLVGPVVAIHIFFTIFSLFHNSDMITDYFVDYLRHAFLFAMMFLLIDRFASKNYRVIPTRKRLNLRGMLLALGTWPIYTLSFLCTLLNLKVPFIATPKEANGGNFLKLIIPQIITVILLLAAIVWRVFHDLDYASAIISAFAILLIFMHGGIFYAVWEGWRISRREKTSSFLVRLNHPESSTMAPPVTTSYVHREMSL